MLPILLFGAVVWTAAFIVYPWSKGQTVRQTQKSEFVERFPELSLFFKAYSLLDSEMICIFPYFCPYAESAREIREIFS